MTFATIKAPFITHLTNHSFKNQQNPIEFMTIVFPHQKQGSVTDVDNYRHISILLLMKKIFENVMFIKCSGFLEKFNILFENSFAPF